ncbi:hypothetical protein LPB140_06960 [Sphingorhabdus lutea]|uniref:Enoyl-CoA hydratase n=2 Tax=Sphingorhabdus lutea TaxID=1913578 RepID=A0A1L3JEV6_9SPHN|nr:hypothetical protein LPB140_06960 [Sphingorhabdus lutea]
MRHFDEISLRHDMDDKIFWCFMEQKLRPCYTYKLGGEIQQVQDWVRANYSLPMDARKDDLRYFICGSKTPNIYNLGGDLMHFVEKIQGRDIAALRNYAETCVRMQYANHKGYDAPIISMALVQGDALGGGFEHALSFDLIVAEKRARFGLPEILFNLFPGMGAYNFLIQRVGRRTAEQMILNGKLYSAQEMYDLGVVDILVEDGEGEQAIVEYVRKNEARFWTERAVYQARTIANPVKLEDLLSITYLWAETAMKISDVDMKKMQRLASAQDRRIARSLAAVD